MKLKEFLRRDSHASEPREPDPIRNGLATIIIPERWREKIACCTIDNYASCRDSLDLPELSAIEAGSPEQMEIKMKELESSLYRLLAAFALCLICAIHGIAQRHIVTVCGSIAVAILFPARKIASVIAQQCIILYYYDRRGWQRR